MGRHIRVSSRVRGARPPVVTRLVLPSDEIVAGASMSGVLVVDNETGAPIHEPICGAWTVELTNEHVPVRPLSTIKCGPGPVFAAGVHRYAFSTRAVYPYGVGPPVGPDDGPPTARARQLPGGVRARSRCSCPRRRRYRCASSRCGPDECASAGHQRPRLRSR